MTPSCDPHDQPAVVSLQVGRVAPLGPQGVPSAFVKTGVAGAVRVGVLGLDGDEQADLSVHGGPDKAVYAYAASRYAAWAVDFPQHAALLVPGAFGENLTIAGLDEATLCAGDIHEIGSALLQVCQPRQPCFKFALRFADTSMPRAMVRSGRSGWYYRVLREGTIAAGDAVHLVERPHPDLAFETLIRVVYRNSADRDELAAIAAADGVAQWLRESAAASLDAARG